MSTFLPPSRTVVPPVLPSPHPGNRLMRHFRSRPEGTNVYYLSDGEVTETDPDSVNVFWHSYDGSPYVQRVFWGSTADPYDLTASEATALDDAGYTVL